ncbi:MAG TPA: GMC oxidoreductase [Nitrospira sp.]|nr:GMC oxidoreductase [Nitrospira sp.]
MKPISRRSFLKLAVATGMVFSVGGCSLLTPSPTHPVSNVCSGTGPPPDTEFDYIVIGSGAGGGPVASNLAEAGYRVLLLEAGGETENADYAVPAFHPLSTEDPDLQWNYFVRHYANDARQNQDTKRDKNGRGIWYPRAGTLGGCTAHNAMITVYPHESDWDRIAALTGDDSWSSDKMRKYFQLVERCQYTSRTWDTFTGGRHGFNGWLSTERPTAEVLKKFVEKDPQFQRILATVAITTVVDLPGSVSEAIFRDAIPKLFSAALKEDINHMRSIKERPEGLYFTPVATNGGRRASVRDRIRQVQQTCANRLAVKTNVLVTKILLEETTTPLPSLSPQGRGGGEGSAKGERSLMRAVGVECREGAHLYRADPKSEQTQPETTQYRAKREVIVSAGAFNTPQLLMLSGIGPREQLDRHQIPVQIDLPGVGKNLQDRYEVGIVYKMKEDLASLVNAKFQGDEQIDPVYREWKEATPDERRNGKGFLYSSNGVVIAVLKRSSIAKQTNQSPDLFIFGLPSDFRGYEQGYTKNITIKNHFTWLVLKAHTRNSGGEVTLRSNDPRDTPQINFKYFEEGNDPDKGQEDLQAMVEAVALIRQMMSRLTENGEAEEIWPGPGVSDTALREWIMNEAWGHHASCSCKLGAKDDATAVLDNNFRVRGTTNLRVVDASIFPYIPGFFIVTPIYMIAEKASEVILADAKQLSA